MKFTEEQPKHGDNVVTCGHKSAIDTKAHFFATPDQKPMEMIGPNGPVEVNWLVCCHGCAVRSGLTATKVRWMELTTWIGNEPEIKSLI